MNPNDNSGAGRCHDRQVPFDLMVTDVVMPGMSGIEPGARMRAERPDLAVLCMSGYTASTMPRTIVAADAWSSLLEKPFSPG
jgi:two-component system, cell cycle sensor histidine kinase and response regulator CckA